MTGNRVVRAAGTMVFGILISRLLGFVRERAVAEVFGRSEATDAFYAAFGIPDLMYYLLVGGALSAAFIPVFTSYLAKGEEREGWRVASTFINLVVVLLISFTVLGIIFAPYLAPLVAYKFTGDQLRLLIKLMRIMFPAVFFTALAGMEMGILNSYQHFTAPVIGPIVYNVAIILGAYLLGPIYGIFGMAAGVVVGAIGNFAVQFPLVLRFGTGYRLRIYLDHPGIQKMVHLMIPALLGLSISQLNLIIGQNLASGLQEGSITALRLANRLVQFPLGVFAMGVSTAIFPTMTRQAARAELTRLKHTLSTGMRAVFLVTVPSAMGLLVLREPIVRLLFEYGEFGPKDTAATAYALLFYSFGLFSLSGTQIITRAFYSLHDTKTPVKVGAASVLLSTLLSLFFLRNTVLDHGGLALSFSLASLFSFLCAAAVLRSRLGSMDGRRIVRTVGRSLAASFVMGTVAWFAAHYSGQLVDLTTAVGRIQQVAAGAGAGALTYALAMVLLGREELQYLRRLVASR